MQEEKRYPLEDMEENRRYFDEVADLLLSREKEENGFGTLQEKTIHEVIKDFYCYDHDFQEQKRAVISQILRSEMISGRYRREHLTNCGGNCRLF